MERKMSDEMNSSEKGMLVSDEGNVCNLKYLDEMMAGKKTVILSIIDAFLTQIPEELKSIDDAIKTTDFENIRKFSHTMKSTVSIMGISSLTDILDEMERLGGTKLSMERVVNLNTQLRDICSKAIMEVTAIRLNYIE